MTTERPYGRILVGLDGEGEAGAALRRALSLGQELGAEVDVTHAVDLPVHPWTGVDLGELARIQTAVLDDARSRVLETVTREVKETGWTGRAPEELLRVHPGSTPRVLLEACREHGSDLIVLGPHKGRAALDFGSTARAVTARSPVPVWVQGVDCRPVRRILAPIDFSDHALLALEHAGALARALGAEVIAFHAYTSPTFAYSGPPEAGPMPTYVVEGERQAAAEELERFVRELAWGDVTIETRMVEGEPRQAILRAAEEHDLVVIGTHGRTGLARFLLGSVAYAVLEGTRVPTLVVPNVAGPWQLHDPPHGDAAD